jgi:hypothetical protein
MPPPVKAQPSLPLRLMVGLPFLALPLMALLLNGRRSGVSPPRCG